MRESYEMANVFNSALSINLTKSFSFFVIVFKQILVELFGLFYAAFVNNYWE